MTDSHPGQTQRRSSGIRWALPAAVLLLMAAAFWWTGRWMVIRWQQENSYYSHGWLIPAVCAVLIYLKRRQIASCPVQPRAVGLLVLVPSLLLHMAATAWQVGFVSGFALVGAVAGVVLTLAGPRMLRHLAFPIAFLIFMVPLPEVLVETVSFRMKLAAARIATAFVELVGIVAVREGSYIRTPTGAVVVDDVCSGLKYMISLTAFGALYAHIASLRTWAKGLLFALSVPVAFVANVVRVILMLLVAHQWGAPATQAWYFHDLFGFALFVAAFVMLFGVESVLLRTMPGLAGRREAEAETDVPAGPAAAPQTHRPPRARAVAAAAVVLLAAAGGLSLYLTRPRSTPPASEALDRIPLTMADWQGYDYTLSDRVYELLGTHDVLARSYTNRAGARADLMIVLARQMHRRTHPPEQCFAGEGWAVIDAADRRMGPEGGSPVPRVRELVLERRGERLVVWYFYKSGTSFNTSYWRHQGGVALRKLAAPDAADVLVRVDARAPERDVERARGLLRDFVDSALPAILAPLP